MIKRDYWATEAIPVRDLEDGVLHWNKSAGRIFGWIAQEIIEKRWDAFCTKTSPMAPNTEKRGRRVSVDGSDTAHSIFRSDLSCLSRRSLGEDK